MSQVRALPWTALLEAVGESRLEEIRDGLAKDQVDSENRDAFVLTLAVVRLLREIVPDDSPAEAVTSYAALLHMLYLLWVRGWPLRALHRERLRSVLATPDQAARYAPPPTVCYVQLAEHVVWAAPAEGSPHEPLDGMFVLASPPWLRVLAVLGFRPDRAGFTTIEAELRLPAPELAPRPDGGAPFQSVLPEGRRAGLYSVVSADELAALALLALRTAEG